MVAYVVGRLGQALRRVLPIAVLFSAGAYWSGTIFVLLSASGQGFDFATYYGAALAVRDHASANIYDLHVIQAAAIAHRAQLPLDLYVYPPVLAVLQVPLTLLPYDAARLTWIALNVVCWLGSTMLLAVVLRDALGSALVRGDTVASGDAQGEAGRLRVPRHRQTVNALCLVSWGSPADTWHVWAIAALVSMVYLPFSLTLGYGEINGLILLLLLLAYLLERHGRPGLAGALLGVAVVIKLFPVVVVGYYALRGRWRVVRGAALSCLALALLTAVVVGPVGIANARLILTNGGDHVLRPANEALMRVPYWITRLLGGTQGPITLPVGYVLAGAVGIGFVVVLLRSAGGWRNWLATQAAREETGDGARELIGYGWALCTMVLVSPVTWEHHDVWLLPGIIICIGVAIRWLARVQSVWSAEARVAWTGLAAGVVGYALTMDHLPLNFDLSLSQSIGPYLLGVPLRPGFMLVRPVVLGLVWLALGLLFVRSGELAAKSSHPLPLPAAGREDSQMHHRKLSANTLLAGTLMSLVVGIVVVAGTYTTVQALVH